MFFSLSLNLPSSTSSLQYFLTVSTDKWQAACLQKSNKIVISTKKGHLRATMARALISSIRSLTGKLVETLTQNSETESSSSASESQNKGVRDDLEQLHRTFRRIQAVLQDAEDKEILDKSVKIWLSDLRAVAHEAEDVLDEYQYELLRFAVEGRESALEASSNKGSTTKMEEIYGLPLFPSSFSSYGFASTANIPIPCGMTDRIKEINDKFMEIYEGHEKFSLREGDGHRRFRGIQKRPPSTSLVDEKGVIGREEDKEKVIDLLISQSSSFAVIPIVGMGGVGKTTLAQLIYNDSRVSQLFDRKAWVSVSYVFDVIRLMREIYESITEKNCDVTQANKLQENLVEKLEGRKFLLVLDDVWNEERNLWEHFRVAFKSAKLVTILTTSRGIFVAQIMQTVPPYHLDTLLEDQSWALFKNCVFGTQKLIEQSDLVEIGKKIVRKCGGLPLAIKALGGVLRHERNMERWIEVLECCIWELDAGKQEIMSPLILSYYMIPSHLRPCFLYLSMFPKDKEFQRDQVVRMWMAQGYINPQSNKRLHYVGRKYFDELYSRSLLLSFSKYGETMYRMHSMIHDMAASFSSRICSGVSYGTHHLYINNNRVFRDFLVVNNPRALRTLLNHRLDTYSSNSFEISLASFLRVLDADLYGQVLPDSIGKLKLLRYLCIAGHNMRRLPESLCLLYHLQTLDLQNCSLVLELPQGIGNLINLRFLRLCSQEIRKLPDSICLLHNLQVLDLKCCYKLGVLPSGIEHLISLHYLDISHSEIKSMIPGIGRLTNLQNLQAIFHIKGDDNHIGMGEMKDLINLKGTLCISRLENIVDVGYSRNVNMISKHNLKAVKLAWRVNPMLENLMDDDEVEEKLHLKLSSSNSQDVMNSEQIEEAVLDSLQPSSNVINLTIHGYNGIKFPDWFGDPCSLAKLSTLVLVDNNVGNDNLSCLGKLPSLRSLLLINLGLEIFGDCEENTRNCGEIRFPSLDTLECRCMYKWKQFLAVDGDFPLVRKLLVEHCSSLSKLHIFPSLHSLDINECKSLCSLNICEHNSENNAYELRSLVVKHCPISSCGLESLSELRRLEIIDCGMYAISLPIESMVECMHISHCRFLNSLLHLENINSIVDLRLTSCPLLNLPEIMPMPDMFQIVDCPELKRWSHQHKLNYFEKLPPLKELIISNDQDIPMVHYLYNRCLEYLCTKPYSTEQTQETDELISYHFCTSNWGHISGLIYLDRITKVQLFSCKKVISIDGLNNLCDLKHLIISNCPQICHLLGEFLPSTLESLIVKECDKLCSIPSFKNSNALKEVEIWDCPEICHLKGDFLPSKLDSLTLKDCVKLCSIPSFKYSNVLKEVLLWNCVSLTALMDMHCLISLKTLLVNQCSELCISPIEILQVELENVIIRDCPLMRDWCRINNIPYTHSGR